MWPFTRPNKCTKAVEEFTPEVAQVYPHTALPESEVGTDLQEVLSHRLAVEAP
jgi:hypothetical protein